MLRECKAKRKKIMTFSQGDFVSVRIPRIDRASTDDHRLPCVVVERRGEKHYLYRLRYIKLVCVHIALNVLAAKGDPYVSPNVTKEQLAATLQNPMSQRRRIPQRSERYEILDICAYTVNSLAYNYNRHS